MQIINNNGKIRQQINIKTNDTPLNFSDKITKREVITRTVVFEIEPSGDCVDCKAEYAGICCAFMSVVKKSYTSENESNKQQCERCKEYLESEKSKVRCDNCKYFIYDWMESECTKGNENTYGETFARDDWFCVDCQDRSE